MNITDHEYGLIRNRLSPSMVEFFDGLRASGSRLCDSIDGSKLPYIRAWHRAVEQAQADGLTRRPRIHDLRSEFIHRFIEKRRSAGAGE